MARDQVPSTSGMNELTNMLVQQPFREARVTVVRLRPLLPALVLLAGAAAVFVCAAWAAEPETTLATQPVEFSIPAQPLPSALHEFGRRVGVQVLYESQSAAGRQSQAVQGRFVPDKALRRLLGDADLEIRHASRDAITLVAPSGRGQDLPPTNPLAVADLSIGELRVRPASRQNDLERFSDYSEIVRSEIQRALLKNAKTGSGNYRAIVDLWIDPSRTIRKATLLRPTGESGRDVAITTTLEGLEISRPTPAGAPQPIRAVVVVSTAR